MWHKEYTFVDICADGEEKPMMRGREEEKSKKKILGCGRKRPEQQQQ